MAFSQSEFVLAEIYDIFQPLTLLVDYIIEKEPLVNKFISVPKDKGNQFNNSFF